MQILITKNGFQINWQIPDNVQKILTYQSNFLYPIKKYQQIPIFEHIPATENVI